MISQEKIAEIRNRASIVEVVSDFVTLRKAGRNHLGLCPFHAEKSPSFTVSEEKGIYHCFGCHTGGSVFHFLMQYDHLSFPESVEWPSAMAFLSNGASAPGRPKNTASGKIFIASMSKLPPTIKRCS